MRILYLSDNYTYNVMGTKRSIAEEVQDQGHEVAFKNRTLIDSSDVFLKQIDDFKADQVWLAHSALIMSSELKSQIKIPIIGFGFSDPYYFSIDRFKSYDVYVTNHYETLENYKHLLPMHYNPTACDFKFHKNLNLEKIYDASLIGLAIHPRFHEKSSRVDYVNALRKDVSNLKIAAFGNGWPKNSLNFEHIDGQNFLNTINLSYLGLDVQDDWSPLAHRMFEYSACQVPVITRRRSEVFNFFDENKEILTYDHYDEFRDKIRFYCSKQDLLKKIGCAAEERCRKEHDIKYRVQNLLKFLKSFSLIRDK